MSYSNKSPKVIISENILYRERKHKCLVCQITLGRNYSFYFQFDFFQDFSLLFLKKKKLLLLPRQPVNCSLFSPTNLLKYSSRTRQIGHLKWTAQWLLVCLELCGHQHCPVLIAPGNRYSFFPFRLAYLGVCNRNGFI